MWRRSSVSLFILEDNCRCGAAKLALKRLFIVTCTDLGLNRSIALGLRSDLVCRVVLGPDRKSPLWGRSRANQANRAPGYPADCVTRARIVICLVLYLQVCRRVCVFRAVGRKMRQPRSFIPAVLSSLSNPQPVLAGGMNSSTTAIGSRSTFGMVESACTP